MAGVYAQIDSMLENGEQAIEVEAKTKLRQSEVDEHGDKRQFMGAMAAFVLFKI